MFFLKEYGKSVTMTYDIGKVMDDLGLNYKVTKSSVYYQIDERYVKIKQYFHAINMKNKHDLGRVNPAYKVVNNENAWYFLNPVCTKPDGPKPIYGGMINFGAKAWLWFKLSQKSVCVGLTEGFVSIVEHSSLNRVSYTYLPYCEQYECFVMLPEGSITYWHSIGKTNFNYKYQDILDCNNKARERLEAFYAKAVNRSMEDEEIFELAKLALTRKDSFYEGERRDGGYGSYRLLQGKTLWHLLLAICKFAESSDRIYEGDESSVFNSIFWETGTRIKLHAFEVLENFANTH